MIKQLVCFLAVTALMSASAYAAQAPVAVEEDDGFPLAIVFALIAVFCGVGTALFAATQSKKKD
jgi:hypothetical protein